MAEDQSPKEASQANGNEEFTVQHIFLPTL